MRDQQEPTIQQLFDLTGKTALITGASGHLGSALLRRPTSIWNQTDGPPRRDLDAPFSSRSRDGRALFESGPKFGSNTSSGAGRRERH